MKNKKDIEKELPEKVPLNGRKLYGGLLDEVERPHGD